MKVLPSGFHLNGHTIGSLSTETQKIYNYLAYKRHNSNIPEEFGTGRLILREAGLFYGSRVTSHGWRVTGGPESQVATIAAHHWGNHRIVAIGWIRVTFDKVLFPSSTTYLTSLKTPCVESGNELHGNASLPWRKKLKTDRFTADIRPQFSLSSRHSDIGIIIFVLNSESTLLFKEYCSKPLQRSIVKRILVFWYRHIFIP